MQIANNYLAISEKTSGVELYKIVNEICYEFNEYNVSGPTLQH